MHLSNKTATSELIRSKSWQTGAQRNRLKQTGFCNTIKFRGHDLQSIQLANPHSRRETSSLTPWKALRVWLEKKVWTKNLQTHQTNPSICSVSTLSALPTSTRSLLVHCQAEKDQKRASEIGCSMREQGGGGGFKKKKQIKLKKKKNTTFFSI